LSTKIVILSLVGTLLVILNKPIAKAFYWMEVEMYGSERNSLRFYRATFIVVGVVLTCLSFAVYD
jgi:hypothetical protein